MDTKAVLERVVAGGHLDRDEARQVMGSILAGECAPEWIAGLLVALRTKGETPAEITGFAQAMRAAATPIRCNSQPLVDTCGTGGDASGTFNISTAAAFVVAACGGHVAKHGNRSVSSHCGSADVLEALGVNLGLSPERAGHAVDKIGFGFLFAPALHGAMKHAVGPRKALALRTVFNVLGPLTNPAGARHQVMGVFDESVLEPLGHVMLDLGQDRSLLVHGSDGLDEFTVTGPTSVVLVDGGVEHRTITPESVGLHRHPAQDLLGGDATRNAEIIRNVFAGRAGAPRDIVVLNAGAALFAARLAGSIEDGCTAAARAIDQGDARQKLEAYVEFTKQPESA